MVQNKKAFLLGFLALTVVYLSFNWLLQTKRSGTTIHLVGDSTMAIQLESRRPYSGWGEPFEFMLCEHVVLNNQAINGASSKSYITQGLWNNVLKQVQPNDVVLIQFGHNDQKNTEPDLYTNPWQDYQNNLRRFVLDIRALNAKPILLTSITRRSFNAQGDLEHTLGDYPAAMQEVAQTTQTMLIDLHTSTQDLLESKGIELSKSIYVHLEAGVHENYPQGIQDETHLSPAGASEVASIVALKMKEFFPTLVCG